MSFWFRGVGLGMRIFTCPPHGSPFVTSPSCPFPAISSTGLMVDGQRPERYQQADWIMSFVTDAGKFALSVVQHVGQHMWDTTCGTPHVGQRPDGGDSGDKQL